MKPLDLAHQFLNLFYSGQPSDLNRLDNILAEDLVFDGPLNSYSTSADYIQDLHASPPVGMSFDVVNQFESDDTACVVYTFRKETIETTMVQIFKTSDGLIVSIRLIFDASLFQ